MKTAKSWLKRLRQVSMSDRQTVAIAVVIGSAFAMLVIAWLAMSTRTALLNQQVDELDVRQMQLTDDINKTWTEIGEETAPRAMEDRARRLGFKPAENIEYLVTTPEATVTVTTTATITLTSAITP